MTSDKFFILVDGSSYLYRAFHALPPLENSKGFPTGAIYGVVSMLKKLISDYSPDQMAVIFDSKEKTFRDELYPAYKATRQAPPDDLIKQIEPLHNIIRAMGLPLMMVEGVEADDVIGTLSEQASKLKRKTLISTSDKDMAQLVNEHVTLVNTMTNQKFDAQGVKLKFGILPERMIDYLTLVGDTSDNIKGVPQVGPKTAVKWLSEYGSLDNLIQHANDIKGKAGENFRQFLPNIPLTKMLVTIKKDVLLPLHLNDILITPKDDAALFELYKDLEFKNWLYDLKVSPIKKVETKKNNQYEIIQDKSHLTAWITALKASNQFSFDTETTSLDAMRAHLVGVSFAIAENKAAYIPLSHDYPDAPLQLKKEDVLQELKIILEDRNIKKIGQNIKYDFKILANENIFLEGIAFDTMLESYLIDSTEKHDMDSLAEKYLNFKTITYQDVAGSGAKQKTFNQIDIAIAGEYAAEDADITLKLHHALWPKLAKNEKLKDVFENIEMPLISILANMERHGVLIDPVQLKNQGEKLSKRLIMLESEIFNIAGESFNLNSPKQLQEILFSKLKLPVLQKTSLGQPSTADAVLQELSHEFELPRLIIEYRSISKLISTYTSKLIEQINPETKRIHTSYHQAGTSTGRLSSSDPNLQNIPIRTTDGKCIRQAFIAPLNKKILSADYSQIELRLMAHMSNDPTLMSAFKNNLDIHKATASEVWNIPLEKVTSDERRHAKAVNFGLIYGMSAFGLSKQLGIEPKAAQKYIDLYFSRYPNVKLFMDESKQKAHEFGFIETLFGRRLYLPEINAHQVLRQKAAERAAINAPLQGTAADIIKIAMINIDKWLKKNNSSCVMIMQVHDELVFEVDENEVDKISAQIKTLMQDAVSLCVPLDVSIGFGDNWDMASEAR